MPETARTAQGPLALVVVSNAFERMHYALATAAAAAAGDRSVILFFAQGAVQALAAGSNNAPGWHRLPVADPGLGGATADVLDRAFRERGAAGFEELLAACRDLGVAFLVCSMGLRVANLSMAEIRTDLGAEETGLVDILSRGGMSTFI